jgi:hypothetical protein
MLRHRVVPLLLPLALLLSCAARASAPPNPYTVDQIERLLRGGVHPEKILADARRECIAFRRAGGRGEASARGRFTRVRAAPGGGVLPHDGDAMTRSRGGAQTEHVEER